MKLTAIQIVEQLRRKGYEAYWAGGCVRDMLLGIKPKDFDIVTNAKPEEIEAVLEKTIPVGKQFGVILAIANGHHFEVATFRSDSGYSDGRRPDAVLFTNAKEDALRRDFTINALFYDPILDKVIDYVEGQKDLEARIIRFIGDPDKRILEDHLRVLRAVRFKNDFDFQYHPDTYTALKRHAHHIKKISKERIRDEINKMLIGKNRRKAFEELCEVGVLKEIIPELEKMHGIAQPYEYHQEGDVWEHTMRAIDCLSEEADLMTRLAVLLHDIGKPDTFKMKERIRFDGHCERSKELTEHIMKRLRYSKKQIECVTWLVDHHMIMVSLVEMPIGRRRHWFLRPDFPRLMEVFRCDAMGALPVDLKLYNQIKEMYEEDLKHMPHEPKKLLTGYEIMKYLNLQPGKEVGRIAELLREKQLAKEIKTQKQAINWLKTLDLKKL